MSEFVTTSESRTVTAHGLFNNNTIEEIENTNLVEDALSKGLKKRNYDVF